jgi:5-(carboxyamino)imidazole ribonucleotide synthase
MSFNPNTKIGILGGGQLGRMILQSAIDFNLNISILDPDENAPCKSLVDNFEVGKLTDFDTVYIFGKQCDLITIEIENVNTDALKKLQSEGKKVFPQPEIIELIKDKGLQKQFYKENNIPTSPFILIENLEDLMANKDALPAVQKLRTEGYDGRGVQVIKSEDDFEKGFDVPCVLEDLIDFKQEIAVIVARNETGDVKSYPAVEMEFHPTQNLVEFLFSPANISQEVEEAAQKLASDLINKLGMVGLLAVEMFVTKDDQLLVNEIAPRPHNSGHQSIEGSTTSQFEQHLRAILNLPLGDTSNVKKAVMLNLLGEENHTGSAVYLGLEACLDLEDVHIHLYGKKLTKPFRKMGHVTVLDENMENAKNKAKFVKSTLKILTS